MANTRMTVVVASGRNMRTTMTIPLRANSTNRRIDSSRPMASPLPLRSRSAARMHTPLATAGHMMASTTAQVIAMTPMTAKGGSTTNRMREVTILHPRPPRMIVRTRTRLFTQPAGTYRNMARPR